MELGYSLPDDVTKAVDREGDGLRRLSGASPTPSPRCTICLRAASAGSSSCTTAVSRSTGLATGYNDLDELLSGLQPSSLVVVGARPSMGKCVCWDTPILDPRTGAVRTAAQAHRLGLGGHEVAVASLTADGSLAAVAPEAFVDDGIKPVFRVRTRQVARCARRSRIRS